jgi:type I restriction enzyme, S subunit
MKKAEKMPLEEVCDVDYGTRVVQKRDGGSIYPVYGGGGATFQMDEFNREDHLVIARFGMSEKCTRFVTGKFFLNDSGLTVSPKNGTLLQRFLDYQILSLNDDIFALGKGAAQKNLDVPAFRALPIFVPSDTKDQQRIVDILDKAFEGISTARANAEKNLQNARALFESYLQSVLLSKRWKQKTLGEVCESVEYGSSAKSKKEGEVPVLRMGNIQDGKLDWEKLVYTDDEEEINKYLLKHNDVLFNRTNSPELVGKTAIYKSEMPAIFAGYLIRIHRKEDLLDADYLNYYLNSEMALNYGKTVTISSVNQANINGAKLKGYPVPVPPISEQRTIVKKLDLLAAENQRLTDLYERKLAALEALKRSLLHQAFTGKL